jgi:hypothetical protein
MSEVHAVDTMLLERDGTWWMLTNIAPEGSGELGAALHVFSAGHPLTDEWKAHPRNPVEFSAIVGRNGGLLRDATGAVYRVRQRYGYNQYGAGASIARIDEISPTDYRETTFCEVEPRFMPDLEGTHHVHSDGMFTVVDLLREESLS